MFCKTNKNKIMERCLNCQSVYGNSNGFDTKKLSEDSLTTLNSFLPEYLRRNSFCSKCINTNIQLTYDSNLFSKYQRYMETKKQNLSKVQQQLDELNKEILKTKSDNYEKYSKYIYVYTCKPEGIELIKMVEGFIIVDSGMWSTSSDNLNSIWTVIHDSIAREGIDSTNKISIGLNNVKELVKKSSFVEGGNCVVDFKYTFSELSSNGKILIIGTGTCGIDESQPIFNLSELDSSYSSRKSFLENSIFQDSNDIKFKNSTALKELIDKLDFE